jgi:ammonia channel protein AmtB
MHSEPLFLMLILGVPLFVGLFFARLFGANRARKKFERNEISWQKYQGFQKHNRLYIIIGVILLLIGCYGFITQPRFIIREDIFEVVEVNPYLVIFFFMFSWLFGGASLAIGLAQFVYSVIKPSADRE